MTEEERLKEFLTAIVANCGQVCEEYETCTHKACRSSYNSWALAEAALVGGTLEDVRGEQAKATARLALHNEGKPIAIGIQCFKCGNHGITSQPIGEEFPTCRKCKSKDVVIMDIQRTPDGGINNCALRCGVSDSDCQMCFRGPCPEGILFNPRPKL